MTEREHFSIKLGEVKNSPSYAAVEAVLAAATSHPDGMVYVCSLRGLLVPRGCYGNLSLPKGEPCFRDWKSLETWQWALTHKFRIMTRAEKRAYDAGHTSTLVQINKDQEDRRPSGDEISKAFEAGRKAGYEQGRKAGYEQGRQDRIAVELRHRILLP